MEQKRSALCRWLRMLRAQKRMSCQFKDSTAVQRAPDFFLHRTSNVLILCVFLLHFFAMFWNRQDILATVILLIHANLCVFSPLHSDESPRFRRFFLPDKTRISVCFISKFDVHKISKA